jgi:hypothetical protein
MVLKQLSSDGILLQKYLLGQASAEDQRTIEQRLMTEQDYYDQLLKMEEELTDTYVRGELKAPDKEAFEKHFLCSPERQRNLEFARALNRYLLANEQPPTTQLRWYGGTGKIALLCAVLVLAILSGVLWHKTAQLNEKLALSELQRSQAEQREKTLEQQLEHLQQSKTNQPNLPPVPHPADQDLLSLVLTPGINRGADHVPTAVLRPDKSRLLLRLKVQDISRGSYLAELQTLEGKAIWTRSGLKAQPASNGGLVEVVLPASNLGQSDYLLVLSVAAPDGSVNKVATYYFRVQK